jgi:hypothetical protein
VLLVAVALLGLLSLFRHQPDTIELEPVIIAESTGGGNNGNDNSTRRGVPQGVDRVEALGNNSKPSPSLPVDPLQVTARPQLPESATETEPFDAQAAIDRKLAKQPALPNLKPLLKGLPDGPLAGGNAGRGPGHGSGTGTGDGPGNGSAGRLTQKQKRQLRWTLVFKIRNSRDYLDQLDRMKAIIGVQYPDRSIKLVKDLAQRPARLEPAERVPDRIFWMDDNTEAVQSLSAELGIRPVPWRVIAFLPAQIEEELLRKEKAWGKRFGRESEDDISETVFNVEDFYGNITITVTRQEGKK